MLSRRTITGPCTGYFHTPVKTVRPCHGTFFGIPTFTESNDGIGSYLRGGFSTDASAHRGVHAPGAGVPMVGAEQFI